MKTGVILIFMFLTSVNLSYGQLTVASLLELKETANGLVLEAGNLIDRQRQQAFIDLSALITYSFDQLDGSLNDLDKRLTKKERAFYAQLEQVILKASTAMEEQRVELFQDLDRTIGNAIADLPFTKNNPYPTGVRSPFIGEKDNGSFRVKLLGVKLDNYQNYAELNGIKSTKTYVESRGELTFEIPINQAVLELGSSNILKFSLFKGKKEFNFEVPFWVYPEKFADITFHYTYTKNVATVSHHEQIKEMRSPNSCSWTHNSSNISRVNQGQWEIDVQSVRVRENRQAPGGGDCSIESITPAMIGTRVTARSDCRGHRRFNPRQGVTTCTYSWNERLSTPTEFTDSRTLSLSYNDSKVVTDFPHGITKFVKAVITYYNGQTFEFLNNAYDNHYIKYYYDGSREAFQVQAAFQDFSDRITTSQK